MRLFPDREYTITPNWLPAPSKRRSKLPANKIRFLVAHDTGNPGSTAAGNVKYYEKSCQEASASAHIFVDDKQIIECVPALTTDRPEKAWHVRYNCPEKEDLRRYKCHANDAAIGFEYCYGANINADEAYKRFVWVLAYACWKFTLDPARDIIGHHELDPSRKTDPVSGLKKSGRTFAQLLRDVADALARYSGAGVGPAGLAPAAPALGPDAWMSAPPTGTITVRARLNLRYGQPSREAPGRVVPAGQQLEYTGRVLGEDIGGNNRWYALEDDEYCWSGGILGNG
ncbi:peptidoglycan recognition protein family protein [Hymenobacter ruricola]|uniref:peptidoglycan recognition protein family protein n=1 Tax=Hymenobacter ruricola TaxID=2791023 RepID=UPI001E28D303|nr:peptidoglycan recognition family protein [Hymenobacter ruricola]